MKKKEVTLYAVEAKDRENEPWRCILMFRSQRKALANACRIAVEMVYHDVRTAEWVRKEGEQ